jgi:aspartate/methionine/tyrosine aminotransferase
MHGAPVQLAICLLRASIPCVRLVTNLERASSDKANITSSQSIAQFNSKRLGLEINADQVVVAPGSKVLLFALFDVLQGDVLLPRPSWVSYEPQVKHANKRLFWVETDEEDRHTITSTWKAIHHVAG